MSIRICHAPWPTVFQRMRVNLIPDTIADELME
jgi:hypothetical protein